VIKQNNKGQIFTLSPRKIVTAISIAIIVLIGTVSYIAECTEVMQVSTRLNGATRATLTAIAISLIVIGCILAGRNLPRRKRINR